MNITDLDLRNFARVQKAAEHAFHEAHRDMRAQIANGKVERGAMLRRDEVVVFVAGNAYPAFGYQQTGRRSMDIFVPRDALLDGEEQQACETFRRAGVAAAHAFDEEMTVRPNRRRDDGGLCSGVYVRDDNRLAWCVVPVAAESSSAPVGSAPKPPRW